MFRNKNWPMLDGRFKLPTIFLIFLLHHYSASGEQLHEEECFFPDSEQSPFFFDIRSDEPNGTVIVDTAVEPSNAKLSIGSVRSKNRPDGDFDEAFVLRRYDDRFSLILNDNFTSEWFSSSVHELYLYITVVCNQHSYPLITIRVTQKNSHAPQFYGQQPYSIVVDETAAIGSKINTSVLAVDWDSTTKYSVVYDIVNGNEDGYFELDRLKATIDDLNNLSIKFDEPNLNPDETPYFAALIVKKKLDTGNTPRRFNFNISATDGEDADALSNYTSLEIHVRNRNDPTSTVDHASFRQCSYEATVARNSSVGTPVLLVELKENDRLNPGAIELIDISNIFTIDPQNGLVSIADAEKLRRAKSNEYIVFAKLQNESNKRSIDGDTCDEAEIQVTVADGNENVSRFHQFEHFYKFHLPGELLNGSVIGTIQMNETDGGSNELVYRLLGNNNSPFVLEQSQSSPSAQIVANFTGSSDALNKIYTLVVEVTDANASSRYPRIVVMIERVGAETMENIDAETKTIPKRSDAAFDIKLNNEKRDTSDNSFGFEQVLNQSI